MAKVDGGLSSAGAQLNLTLTKLPDTPGRLKRGSATLPRKPFKPTTPAYANAVVCCLLGTSSLIKQFDLILNHTEMEVKAPLIRKFWTLRTAPEAVQEFLGLVEREYTKSSLKSLRCDVFLLDVLIPVIHREFHATEAATVPLEELFQWQPQAVNECALCHKVDSISLRNLPVMKQLTVEWSGKIRLQNALAERKKHKMKCEFCGGQPTAFVQYTRYKAIPSIAVIRPLFPPGSMTSLPVPKPPKEASKVRVDEDHSETVKTKDEVGCYTVLDDRLNFGGIRYEMYAAIIQPPNQSLAPLAFVKRHNSEWRQYKTDTVTDVPYDRVCDSGLPTLLFYRPLKTLSWNNRVDNRDSVHNYSIDPEDEFDLPLHITSPRTASISANAYNSTAAAPALTGTGRLSGGASNEFNMNMNGTSKAATATAAAAAAAAATAAAAAAAAAAGHRGSTDSQNGTISAKGRRGTGFMKKPLIAEDAGEPGDRAAEVPTHATNDDDAVAAAGIAAASRSRAATPWNDAPQRASTGFAAIGAAAAAAASARGEADAAAIAAARNGGASGQPMLIGPNGEPIPYSVDPNLSPEEAKKREDERLEKEKESCRMCQANQSCVIM